MNLSRELYRKERAKAEVNRMVQRYDSECGKVHTYKVDPEILKDYYPGSELPGSKIEAGNDMSGKEKTEKGKMVIGSRACCTHTRPSMGY